MARDKTREGTAVEHRQGQRNAAQNGSNPENRAVSKNARCREFVTDRLDSAESYATFAAYAAVDILDGEPLNRFKAINALDQNAMRKEQLQMRRELMSKLFEGGDTQKKLTAVQQRHARQLR